MTWDIDKSENSSMINSIFVSLEDYFKDLCYFQDRCEAKVVPSDFPLKHVRHTAVRVGRCLSIYSNVWREVCSDIL